MNLTINNHTTLGLGNSRQQSIILPPISADHQTASSGNGKCEVDGKVDISRKMFSNKTKAIVWGMQTRAVQSMLDFDFICR